MTALGKDLKRRGIGQAFSRARIQPPRDCVQISLGLERQVRALGLLLPQKSIRVLIGPALPRAMRISKVYVETQALRELLMLRHFFASIIRQRFAQRGGDDSEFLRKPVTSTLGIGACQAGQDDQTRGPFHQGADSRAIAGSLDESPFPVPGDHTSGDFWGPFRNERHLGHWASTIWSARPRPTSLVSLAQRGQQFTAHRATGKYRQAGIDRLRRKPFVHVGRIFPREPTGNLFGGNGRDVVGVAHTATAKTAGVSVGVELADFGRWPESGPDRLDRKGPTAYCGHTHNSAFSAFASRRWLGCAGTGLERAPGSRSHVLRNSRAYTCSCSRQQLSPIWPEVLHLELKFKQVKNGMIQLEKTVNTINRKQRANLCKQTRGSLSIDFQEVKP